LSVFNAQDRRDEVGAQRLAFDLKFMPLLVWDYNLVSGQSTDLIDAIANRQSNQ
jgi:hypothetical protein